MITKTIFRRLFLVLFITSCSILPVQSPVIQGGFAESMELYQALYCAPDQESRLPAGLACDGLFQKAAPIKVGNTRFVEDLIKNPEVMVDVTSNISNRADKEKYPVRLTTLMRQFRDVFLGFFKSADYREPLTRSFEASLRMHSALTEKSIAQNGGYSQYDLVIAGTGIHGIVALHQALATNPKLKILLVDEGDTAGATFRYGKEVFKINSSNRASGEDTRALPGEGNINELPGLPIQVSDLNYEKYPTANDLGISIVAGLQAALRAHPNVDVLFNSRMVNTFAKAKNGKFGESVEIQSDNQSITFQVDAQKIVIATGLGNPNIPAPVLRTLSQVPQLAESVKGKVPRVITFEDFLRMLAMSNDPMKLIKDMKIGIVGKGDSANVLIEFLLGYGPREGYASSSAQSGRVGKIAWIGQEKLTCEEFIKDIRSRYAPIGTGFRSSSPNVEAIIKPYAGRLADVAEKGPERVNALLENGQSVDGLDFIVVTTGFDKNVRSLLRGVSEKDPATFKDDDAFFGDAFETLEAPTSASPGLRKVGRKFQGREIYVLGTAAGQLAEKKDLVGIIQNFVSIFNNAPGVVASMKKILDGVKSVAQTPPKTLIEVKLFSETQAFIIKDVQESRLMGQQTARYLLGTFQEALSLTRNRDSQGINLLLSLDKAGNLIVTSNNKSDVTELMNLLGKTREFFSLMRQRLLSADGQIYLLTAPAKGGAFDISQAKLSLTKQKVATPVAPIEILNTKVKFRGARGRDAKLSDVPPKAETPKVEDRPAGVPEKVQDDVQRSNENQNPPRVLAVRGAKLDLNNVLNYRKYAIFNELPAAEFKLGSRTIKIEQPFEMMATTVQYGTWLKTIRLLESEYGRDPDLSAKALSEFGYDDATIPENFNPVVNFSSVGILRILSKLNRISAMEKYEAPLAEIFPGHRVGDVYDLPTSREWDYVASSGGTNLNRYINGESVESLKIIANVGATETGITETRDVPDVASRVPSLFNVNDPKSQRFYDLLGSVYQIAVAKDPSRKVVLRGSSVKTKPELSIQGREVDFAQDEKGEDAGFRLVRRTGNNQNSGRAIEVETPVLKGTGANEGGEPKAADPKKVTEPNVTEKSKKEREIIVNGAILDLANVETYRDYGIFNGMSRSKFTLDGLTIEIREPFEMMAAPLTQKAWYRLARLAGEGIETIPSKNQDRLNPTKVSNPVENISPNDVEKILVFINRLSAQKNYEPILDSIFPGHKSGMVYDIPTSEQWNAVTTNEGKNPSFFVLGDNQTLLRSVAVVEEGRTRAVASLAPVVFKDKPSVLYYDLTGNVCQITKGSTGFLARGASFASPTPDARRDLAEIIGGGQRSERIGVRFVRTRR